MHHAPLAPFIGVHANDNYAAGKREPLPVLFATYTARTGARQRVQVITATRKGRVGVTENLAIGAAPKTYVHASELSQFAETPYPLRGAPHGGPAPRAPRFSVHSLRTEARAEAAMRVAAMVDDIACGKCDIRKRVAAAAGVTVADILGTDKHHMLINARRGVIGSMAARNPGASLAMLGRVVGVSHTTALHHLRSIGLHDRVALFDLPHLRALWRRGRMTIGYEPGQMPSEIAKRLAGFVDVQNGIAEPMAWAEFRIFLARHIAEAKVAEMKEQMKCAA